MNREPHTLLWLFLALVLGAVIVAVALDWRADDAGGADGSAGREPGGTTGGGPAADAAALPPVDPAALRADLTLALDGPVEPVALGDDLAFTVTLANGSAERTHRVAGLVEDAGSVFLQVAFTSDDGQVQSVEWCKRHLVPGAGPQGMTARAVERVTLPPQSRRTLAVRLPAVRVGVLTFKAVYAGLGVAGEPLRSAPRAVTVTPRDGRAVLAARMKTVEGDVVLRFFTGRAFRHCVSFADLIKKGAYTGLVFHRVKRDQFIQGGSPTGAGTGGPGYSIAIETHPELKHVAGMVSTARTGHPDTGGQQFFLMLDAEPAFDAVPGTPGREGYSIWAEVIEGLEVARAISRAPVTTQPEGGEESKPLAPVIIESLTLEYR